MYLQTTAMTEPLLVCFFLLSTYYFGEFLLSPGRINSLIAASVFGFLATLSRYDGWFLIAFQALVIIFYYFRKKTSWRALEGKFLLYCTVAGFGILLWFLWNYLILGDIFYFKNSHFSAYAQQLEWLKRNQLPARHNIWLSFLYFFVSAMSNSGWLIFFTSLSGIVLFFRNNTIQKRYLILILNVPFIFNWFTLFMGESIIFIPHLTPATFDWQLFNVRYGITMLPAVAFFFGYLFYKVKFPTKIFLISIIVLQIAMYSVGYSKVISLADGLNGLSRSKRPDAEFWIKKHYDYGLILVDDFAKTISIIKAGFPMQNVIYIGNKPYWEESLSAPEKYARWIIIQKDDEIWKRLYSNPIARGRLYKYFEKQYTSPEILIFRKIKS
jgi:hypothetical protein